MANRTTEELEAGLEEMLRSPQNNGALEMIVRRPLVDQAGDAVLNGRFRFEITDKTGNRTLKLRVNR